eukprot:CAMPEP_0179256724 /NCGR_PEP_ID=MMETSP0797-20121207/24415_1 /TAXON_ID=47934 /ORGANISM="Dinophysis acuminata, Strain DAEP01" /LENGTH=49 /DNA_ID=CAMNT_0020964669 /DNA_START=211 /DNA_END=360 /DNA_ORIENTATION=-
MFSRIRRRVVDPSLACKGRAPGAVYQPGGSLHRRPLRMAARGHANKRIS